MNDNEALFSILHDLTELRGEMLQQESTLESQLDSISKLHLESARNLAQRRISSDWRDFATGSVEHNVIDRVDKGAPRWPANSIARTRTLLWLAVCLLGNMRGDPFQNKLPDQIRCSMPTRARQTIEKDQRSSAIGSRIVKIGNGCGGEAAEHERVIWFPPPIVTPGDDRGRDRVQRARPNTPLPFVEITWVLMKDRRVNRSAQ